MSRRSATPRLRLRMKPRWGEEREEQHLRGRLEGGIRCRGVAWMGRWRKGGCQKAGGGGEDEAKECLELRKKGEGVEEEKMDGQKEEEGSD